MLAFNMLALVLAFTVIDYNSDINYTCKNIITLSNIHFSSTLVKNKCVTEDIGSQPDFQYLHKINKNT